MIHAAVSILLDHQFFAMRSGGTGGTLNRTMESVNRGPMQPPGPGRPEAKNFIA
jgi:hypothetical protein